MPERVPSESVETHRATVERVGRTDRRRVVVPVAATDPFDAEAVIEIVIEERTYHGRVETALDGRLVLDGAYDTPTLARSPGDGENHLADWLAGTGVAVGDSVLFDIVTEGYTVGLRAPGERTVYEATEPPSESLSSIARDLQDRS